MSEAGVLPLVGTYCVSAAVEGWLLTAEAGVTAGDAIAVENWWQLQGSALTPAAHSTAGAEAVAGSEPRHAQEPSGVATASHQFPWQLQQTQRMPSSAMVCWAGTVRLADNARTCAGFYVPAQPSQHWCS